MNEEERLKVLKLADRVVSASGCLRPLETLNPDSDMR